MRVSLWSLLVLMGCTSGEVVDRVDASGQRSDAQIDAQFLDDDAGDDGNVLTDASMDGAPSLMDGLRRGEFDPQNVYLAGTVSEGTCGRAALTDYENPDVAVAGFHCRFDEQSAVISASGTLTYVNALEDRLREFTCDGCPLWNPTDPYRVSLANDAILPTPPCDGSNLHFALSPDGSRIHRCRDSVGWYDPSGAQVLEANDTVLTYGWSGFVLTEEAVININTGESLPLGLSAECIVLTTRSGPETGFRVAVQCGETTELWSVDHGGSATREGVYPAPPPSYPPSFGARLAGDGTLVQEANGPEAFEDAIIERTIEGRSELMYTEASDPAVKIHISSLVTGP